MPTIDNGAADHDKRTSAQAHLGDQTDHLGGVAGDSIADRRSDGLGVELGLAADPVPHRRPRRRSACGEPRKPLRRRLTGAHIVTSNAHGGDDAR